MKFFLPLLSTVASLGAAGLVLVGILDSSFLFLPLGNDLLVLALSAQHPARLAFYALCAASGSVMGAMVVDALARKGGEQGLSKFLPGRRADYIKRKVRNKAGWALALAALLPPPFPFTPFVAAAAAFQFPRRRMIAVLLSARMLRFCVIGVLAVAFGNQILRIAKQPAVQYTLLALVAVCIIGSALSIYNWIKRSSPRNSAKSESPVTVKA